MIDFLDAGFDAHVPVLAFRIAKEKEDHGERYPTKGEIDPEAPSTAYVSIRLDVTQRSGSKLPPTCSIRQSSTQDRTDNGCDPKHT